jgi:hypothetical protein
MFSDGIQRKISCLDRNLFITHYVCNSMVQRKFALNGQHCSKVVNKRKKMRTWYQCCGSGYESGST